MPYAYGADDPVLSADPSGLCALGLSVGSGAGAGMYATTDEMPDGDAAEGPAPLPPPPSTDSGPATGDGPTDDQPSVQKGGAIGSIVKWPTGQSEAGADATNRMADCLTSEQVKDWQAQGLTRDGVERQLKLYETSASDPVKVQKNVVLLPRLNLMRRIIELWPTT